MTEIFRELGVLFRGKLIQKGHSVCNGLSRELDISNGFRRTFGLATDLATEPAPPIDLEGLGHRFGLTLDNVEGVGSTLGWGADSTGESAPSMLQFSGRRSLNSSGQQRGKENRNVEQLHCKNIKDLKSDFETERPASKIGINALRGKELSVKI